MITESMDIDPRLDTLPAEGNAEYLRWSETFHRLTIAYLANVEELKKIRKLDPAHAALYDWKIDSLLRQASGNSGIDIHLKPRHSSAITRIW